MQTTKKNFLVEVIEIPHSGYRGNIIAGSNFFCGNGFPKSEHNLSNKSVGNAVAAREEGVFLEEALAAVAAIAPFAQVQEGIHEWMYFISLDALVSNFTIHEVNYFTFAARQIFH